MSSNIPIRKRDRFLGFFRKSTDKPKGASAVSQSSTPAPPTTPSPQTTDAPSYFLHDALRELTEKEKAVIKEHITSGIGNSVQAVYDAAQKQKTVWQQKRWPGSDHVDKVLVWLDRFKSVGDVVANVDPVHVGLPWAGIRLLLEAAIADSYQMSTLVSGMDLALCIANRLQAYLAYYQRLPAAVTTDNLRKALISLYAHVLRFLARAIQVYSTNTAVRKAQAFWQDSDLTEFERQCDELGARADIEANNCDRELSARESAAATKWRDELGAKLEDIRSINQSLSALQVKSDLSKLFRVQEATYNSTTEEKLSRCLDGTRSQILQNITQWADLPDGKLIFWLCGQAGTGKSTISRTVAQSFDKQNRLGASFFFKRSEKNRSNADHFFSTITAQLADMIPDLQAPVAAALDRDSFLCGRGIQVQFEKLLLQPLGSVNPAHLSRRMVAIVIDALDECDRDTDIRIFLRLLAQVNTKSDLRLRIFLTSRPELPIRLGFQQLGRGLHQDVYLEEVQKQSIRSDIRTYFNNEFAKIRQDQLHRGFGDLLPSDWPSEQDIQNLVALADPLFIFAATVCRFVSESKPQKRLESILEQRYGAGSSHLAKLYLPILDQLLVAKEDEEQQDVLQEFREVVGPIVLAADPLSVTSLASLLDLDGCDINLMLEQLHSVLQVPSNLHDPVRLLHLSFRDFLVDPKRKDKGGFWINEVDTHKRLAFNCLRRLCEDGVLKNDICSVARPGTHRAALSMQQIREHVPPDVAYACSYWPLHFIKSGYELCDDGKVHYFLRRHFLHWLEALSWLGRLSSAVAYIGDLLSVTQGDSCSEVAAFLQDSKRFLLQNRYIVDLAPLQIYHSAMVFSPLQSIVRNTFCRQVPQLWTLLPDVPMRWSAEILKLEGHDKLVKAVAFSPDGQFIVSGSMDKTVRLWDVATGEQVQKLEGHNASVNAVAFSPNGKFIASASDDGTVGLWNTATGDHVQKFKGPKHLVTAVGFSPNGKFIASASDGGTVGLWNTATGDHVQKFKGPEHLVTAVGFSPNGKHIAWVLDNLSVQLWNAATGEQVQEFKGYGYSVSAAAFSPDGQFVALASSINATIDLWNVVTSRPIRRLVGHEFSIFAVAFSPDGQVIASSSRDNTVRLWNVATGEQIQRFDDNAGSAIAFSLDGQIVASTSAVTMIRLWNAATGKQTQKQKHGHDHSVSEVVFSPDGQVVASASDDQTVRLWNTQTGEQMQKLQGHTDRVGAVAFSPDGRVIASASMDLTVRLWNTQTGEQIQKLQGHNDLIGAVAFSPDGQVIASASEDQTVRLWNTQTGEQIQKLQGHSDWVRAVAFSPDGRVIASASDDQTVRLWNTQTGEQTQKLRGHNGWVRAVAFSPDGRVVASASEDQALRLWDVATGEVIQLIQYFRGVKRISFSMDGKSLQTDTGTFLLESTTPGSPTDISTRTTSLELSGQWIRNQGEDLLWLPSEHRGSCSAVQGQTLVIGQASGAVDFFRLG